MRASRRRLRVAAMMCATLAAGHAYANDTASELAAGGLVLTRTDDITIQREDLLLSLDEVRVHYEMRNNRTAPVTLRLAFPMPPVPVETAGGMMVPGPSGWSTVRQVVLGSGSRPDFLNFSISANGRAITPEIEIKALLPDGRNIADALRTIVGADHILHPRYYLRAGDSDKSDAEYEVSSDVLKKLQEIGAVDPTYGQPRWTTLVTYHWMQVFPPGVTKIAHTYRPVVGYFPFRTEAGTWLGGNTGTTEAINGTYCVGAGAESIARRLRAKDGYNYAYTLGYITTTGANWAGPIESFHLRVTGARIALPEGNALPYRADTAGYVALCADIPLRRTGPVDLEGKARNVTPKTDLQVLFVINPRR